jgi:hypothetical protein
VEGFRASNSELDFWEKVSIPAMVHFQENPEIDWVTIGSENLAVIENGKMDELPTDEHFDAQEEAAGERLVIFVRPVDIVQHRDGTD